MAPELFLRVVEIEEFDLGARRHDRADPAVAESQRHLDDGGLGLRNVAGRHALAPHEADFLIGHWRGGGPPRNGSSRNSRSVVVLNSHSIGVPIRAMARMKRASAAAMPSG